MEQEVQGPPRVTVLIVARDCADSLRLCLEALEKSIDRETFEILVVDNGSQDGSAAVPDDFPAVTVLRLPKNFGRTKALNIGTRTAKGDLVLLMDASVGVQPDTVARLRARMADESVGAVCAYSEIVYPLPSAASLKTAWMTGTLPGAMQVDASATEVIVEYPRGIPILVWRRFLTGMRYFDERFGEHWSDLELCWQLRSAGKKIVMLPQIRVSYLREAAVTTGYVDRADSAIGAAAYLGKHYGMPSGLGFRLSAVVHALTRLDFKLLGALVSGQKIDGTQG